MSRTAIIFLALAAIVGIAAPCYCQDREIKTTDGKIYSMDWAASKIVVRWLELSDNSYRELILNVPDDAVIKKGTDTIESSELEIADDVTVEYYENPDGTSTLISLEDTSPSP